MSYRQQTGFNRRSIFVSDLGHQAAQNRFIRFYFPQKTVHRPGASVSKPGSPVLAVTRTWSGHLSSTLQRSKSSSDVDISRNPASPHHTSPSSGGTAHRRGRRESGDEVTVDHPD